jgi:hypothetical protein
MVRYATLYLRRLAGFAMCGFVWIAMLGSVGAQTEPPPNSPSSENIRWLTNSAFKVGLDTSSGGAIAWIGEAEGKRNLINNFDRGRLVQQSWYGREDGSRWSKQPWRWNPVQGGDWQGKSAKILEQRYGADESYVKSQPVHWATGEELSDCVMEQTVKLQSEWIHVRYRFQYSGLQIHPPHHQELPAFFVDASLATLVTYEGASPWTGDALSRHRPGFPNEYKPMTEHWAAYVDDRDYGIGCFVPVANQLTCYRYGTDPVNPDSCSYFAPIRTLAIEANFQFEYDVWISIGTIPHLRDRFARIPQ